jgi:hypothetical protein
VPSKSRPLPCFCRVLFKTKEVAISVTSYIRYVRISRSRDGGSSRCHLEEEVNRQFSGVLNCYLDM